MNLTSAQQTALEAAINANTTAIPALPGVTSAFVGVQVKLVPQGNDQDGAAAVAAFYNQLAAGPFLLFNTAVTAQVIGDNVLFANYNVINSVPPDSTQLYMNCTEACVAKSVTLQNLLLVVQSSGGLFNAARPTLRKGLKDATSNIPGGSPLPTNIDGGWTTSIGTAPGILTRSATIFEALFAVASTGPLAGGTGALGSGGIQGVANVAVPATDSVGGYLQGNLTGQDILAIWNP